LSNLGELSRRQGRYDEAERLFKQSLAIYEAAQHPDTGSGSPSGSRDTAHSAGQRHFRCGRTRKRRRVSLSRCPRWAWGES
jgi:hypothetical protein